MTKAQFIPIEERADCLTSLTRLSGLSSEHSVCLTPTCAHTHSTQQPQKLLALPPSATCLGCSNLQVFACAISSPHFLTQTTPSCPSGHSSGVNVLSNLLLRSHPLQTMIPFHDFWLQALKTDSKNLYNKKELFGGISGLNSSWRNRELKARSRGYFCLIAKSQRKYALRPSVEVSEEVLIGQPQIHDWPDPPVAT